ncbi:MAG: nucleotidyltransferase family protein [Synergistaceae bacterium]|nr:nucleotidyltransferase family protein [Synergistaceae bacterium]
MKKYKVAGIIAEYNPFHMGHLHHVAETKKHAERVIVVMSSNFVQRGEPALFDKYVRSEAAVTSGCDLVLELPVVASCHNGFVFSKCAVALLANTGLVDCLSFGVEDTNFDASKIIDVLLHEDEDFKAQLKKYMDDGYSFIMARSLALEEKIKGSSDYIKGSNNNLALCYRMELAEKFPNISPLAIKRVGSDYNEEQVVEISSATALRKAFANNEIDRFMEQIPPAAREIFYSAIQKGQFVSKAEWKSAWQTLRTLLLTKRNEEIKDTAEIKEGFENTLKQHALTSNTLDEFISSCVSKRYTKSRVARNVCHVLLNYKEKLNRQVQDNILPYIKPLAMNEAGRELLREMKNCAKLPIVTTYGTASCVSDFAREVSAFELASCEIWKGLAKNPILGSCNAEKIRIK